MPIPSPRVMTESICLTTSCMLDRMPMAVHQEILMDVVERKRQVVVGCSHQRVQISQRQVEDLFQPLRLQGVFYHPMECKLLLHQQVGHHGKWDRVGTGKDRDGPGS